MHLMLWLHFIMLLEWMYNKPLLAVVFPIIIFVIFVFMSPLSPELQYIMTVDMEP